MWSEAHWEAGASVFSGRHEFRAKLLDLVITGEFVGRIWSGEIIEKPINSQRQRQKQSQRQRDTVEDAEVAVDVGVEELVEEDGVVAVRVHGHDVLVEHAARLELLQRAPVHVQPEPAHPTAAADRSRVVLKCSVSIEEALSGVRARDELKRGVASELHVAVDPRALREQQLVHREPARQRARVSC